MFIQNGIREWLESNAKWKDADFVINAWLKRDGASTDVVQAGYANWMAVHGKTPQAKTVSSNWAAALERERKALYKEIMEDKK